LKGLRTTPEHSQPGLADDFIVNLIVTGIALAIAFALTLVVDRLTKAKYPLVRLIVDASLWAVAVIFSLSTLGLRTDVLLVLVAIAGFLLAWCVKPMLASYLVQQIYVSSARPLRIGDYVTLGDSSGRVVAMSPFTTTLALRDGSLLQYPNFRLAEEPLVVAPREGALAFVMLTVSFEGLERLRKALPDLTADFRSEMLENTVVRLLVKRVREHEVDATVELSVRNPNLVESVRDELTEKIVNVLR
jgi:small-conductance mechanosensitive channel